MMRDGEGGGHLNSTEVELVTADVKSKMLKGSLEDADTQNVEVGEWDKSAIAPAINFKYCWDKKEMQKEL